MKRYIFLFLSLLILTSVSADYNAFGETNLAVEPCTSHSRNITIQNLDNEQRDYEISVDGSASDFVTFSTINFGLQPSQAAIIQTFYAIPCSAAPDTYNLDIFFNDGTDEKVLSQEILVSFPDTINLTIETQSNVIPPCETATYPITVNNPANFTELYTVEAEGHPNVHVGQQNLVILPKQSKTFEVSVTPDDCTQSGNFPLTLTIETEKSKQQKEIPLEFILTATDIAELAPGINTIRTDYGDNTAELTIRNIGDRQTTYTLTIDGPSWASISPGTVTLKPGQSLALALRLTPINGTPEDNHPLTLTASVQETGITYTKEIILKLKSPTFFEKNPTLTILIIIIAIALIVGIVFLARYLLSSQFKETLARIKQKMAEKRAARQARREQARKENEKRKAEKEKQRKEEAKRKEQERKELEQKEKLSKEKREQEEQARKEREDKIKARLKSQVESEYLKEYLVVARKDIITARNKGNPKKTATIVIILAILALATLFWSYLAPNLTSVAVGIVLLLAIALTRRIIRTKKITVRWKILPAEKTVTLKLWKKGITQLAITPDKTTKNLTITVQKRKPTVAPAQYVYQSFGIAANASVKLAPTLRVSKKWLKSINALPEDIRFGVYRNNTWKTVPIEKVGEDKQFIHYTAQTTAGMHAIYAKVKPKKPSPRRKIIAGIILLAVLAAIAVTLNTPQPLGIIPPQTWKQDTVHALELKSYFKDPDGDSLNYKATPTPHITVDFVNSKAVLTPQKGWSGEEQTKFTADDDKGGVISSNTVSLRVVKTLLPLEFKPTATFLIAILFILVLIWLARSQKQN
ncbi:PGF-pre-PGF domain-containing protein [Candidatus Woesearchaeota archaeon]|nr:PGF-pre-PGF domain-containing protein [Candidatus Woesearchaeota archaeon]